MAENKKAIPVSPPNWRQEDPARTPEDAYFDFVRHQIFEHPVVKEHHGRWKELIAWKEGDQFSEWSDTDYKMLPVELKMRRKRVVVNLMKPLGEAIEGKINMTYSLVGSPNSGDVNDVEASKVATKLIGYNDVVNDIETQGEDVKLDAIDTGNAFMKCIWDRGKSGTALKNPELKAPTSDDDVFEEEGEVVISVPSVFNVRPDPTGKTRDQWRWLIEIDEVPESAILDAFPKITVEELRASLEEKESGETKYKGMNEPTAEKDKEEKTYIVCWYWEKKTKEFPDGRHFISTGRLLLHSGKNYCLGEIPFWHFPYKRKRNSLWATGPFHHVQPIQREINREVSIISEHIEAWKPKMIVPENSIIKEGAFTTDTMELLEVSLGGEKPYPLTMPELSPQVRALLEFFMGVFNTVANVHEVSYSQLPKYSTRAPASLFSMMLEQENLKIDPMLRIWNKNFIEMGRFRLQLMGKYYQNPRMTKVLGKGNEAAIQYFKGADLKGNYDVRLTMGVSLQQSQVVQQQLLMDLKKNGVLGEQDNRKILKLLRQGDISEELTGEAADESKAIRENQAFISDTYEKPREKGGVFFLPIDKHILHHEYHSNLLKSQEAMLWPNKKYQALSEHDMKHVMAEYLMTQKAVPPNQISGPEGGSLSEAEQAEGGGVQPGPIPGAGAGEGTATPETMAMRQATNLGPTG